MERFGAKYQRNSCEVEERLPLEVLVAEVKGRLMCGRIREDRAPGTEQEEARIPQSGQMAFICCISEIRQLI